MDHKSANRSPDVRVIRTRARLRTALVELLAGSDLSAITVQRIVSQAGIGYATFFRHHSSIDALLLDIADQMIADCIVALAPALATGDRPALLAALVDFVATHRPAAHALLVGGGETIRRELTARAVEQTRQLPLGFDPAVPRDLAIGHAVGSVVTILAWWLATAPEHEPASVAVLLDRLALTPLLPA